MTYTIYRTYCEGYKGKNRHWYIIKDSNYEEHSRWERKDDAENICAELNEE